MTQDEDGNYGAESWTDIFGSHAVDLQPIPENKRVPIAGGQYKYESTHKIYPEKKAPIEACREGDFYLIDGSNYRITEKFVFDRIAYVTVLEGAFGIANA